MSVVPFEERYTGALHDKGISLFGRAGKYAHRASEWADKWRAGVAFAIALNVRNTALPLANTETILLYNALGQTLSSPKTFSSLLGRIKPKISR